MPTHGRFQSVVEQTGCGTGRELTPVVIPLAPQDVQDWQLPYTSGSHTSSTWRRNWSKDIWPIVVSQTLEIGCGHSGKRENRDLRRETSMVLVTLQLCNCPPPGVPVDEVPPPTPGTMSFSAAFDPSIYTCDFVIQTYQTFEQNSRHVISIEKHNF